MKKIEKVLIIVSITIALLCVVLSVYEIVNIKLDSETYSRIYGLNDKALHWQFESVLNYQLWQGINIAVAALVAVTGIRILKGFSFRGVFYTALVINVIWFLRYYILWYKSGFDHYPGFDPYFL